MILAFQTTMSAVSADLRPIITAVLGLTPFEQWGTLTPKIIRERVELMLGMVRCSFLSCTNATPLQHVFVFSFAGTRSIKTEKNRNRKYHRFARSTAGTRRKLEGCSTPRYSLRRPCFAITTTQLRDQETYPDQIRDFG